MTRKGDSLPARPHRRSGLINVPERIDAVPSDRLEALAYEASLPERKPHVVTVVPNLDVDKWVRDNAIEVVKGPEPYGNGHKWTLPRCPFNREHAKPILIQFASGVVQYKCLHKSCSENGWAELRHLVQPHLEDWLRGLQVFLKFLAFLDLKASLTGA